MATEVNAVFVKWQRWKYQHSGKWSPWHRMLVDGTTKCGELGNTTLVPRKDVETFESDSLEPDQGQVCQFCGLLPI